MFDDLKQPEDMFSETDKVSPQPVPPTQSASSVAPPSAMPSAPVPQMQVPVQVETLSERQTPSAGLTPSNSPLERGRTGEERVGEEQAGGKMKVIIIVVAILVVIAAAFFISMRILRSKTPTTPEPPAGLQQTKAPRPSAPVVVPEPEPEPVVTPEPEPVADLDTDRDGLMDSEELTLGTNIASSDTDADGLFDREEVEVYETDPLLADTDGDTYLDGAEVKAGYNPKGSGTLRLIPTE